LSTVGCNQCGFIYTSPLPANIIDGSFYKNEYRKYYQFEARPSDDYIERFGKKQRAEEYRGLLVAQEVLSGKTRSILDVGCAEGSLLKSIDDDFSNIDKYGVEKNAVFSDFAEKYSHSQVFDDISDLSQGLVVDRFDIVTINHVLEHVVDPLALLKELVEKIPEGGFLVVSVPDVERYKNLESLHVGHVQHFSLASLENIAGVAGFKMVKSFRTTPYLYPETINAVFVPGQTDYTVTKSMAGWGVVKSIRAFDVRVILKHNFLMRRVFSMLKK